MGRHPGDVRDQRGFTLIEMMIVVGIIAVLAAVVVPGWFRESSKAKHDTEIVAMFGELAVKLEQLKIETGAYLDAAECPAAPVAQGADFIAGCVTGGSAWETLRASPPSSKMYCTYAITSGDSATAPTPPTGFTMLTPSTSWYFIVGTCDMDGQGGTNATFFQSSNQTKMQKLNYGL